MPKGSWYIWVLALPISSPWKCQTGNLSFSTMCFIVLILTCYPVCMYSPFFPVSCASITCSMCHYSMPQCSYCEVLHMDSVHCFISIVLICYFKTFPLLNCTLTSYDIWLGGDCEHFAQQHSLNTIFLHHLESWWHNWAVVSQWKGPTFNCQMERTFLCGVCISSSYFFCTFFSFWMTFKSLRSVAPSSPAQPSTLKTGK